MDTAEELTKNCWDCVYKGSISGDAHICCRFAWRGVSSLSEIPQDQQWGIEHGWWNFPFNFDPIWMIGECAKWSSEAVEEDTIVDNPIFTMLMIR